MSDLRRDDITLTTSRDEASDLRTATNSVPSTNGELRTSTTDHACGKAIIVGEHAAVYGVRAIAMPLRNMRLTISVTPHPQRQRDDGAPIIELSIGGRALPENISAVVMDAMRLLGVSPCSVSLNGMSGLVIGGGLGSSAALCVAILRALGKSAGIAPSPAQLATWANELEKRFHGQPSGLDSAVVAYEEVIAFVKGQTPTPIKVASLNQKNGDRPWPFVLIDSGERASTKDMIERAKPFFTGVHAERRLQEFATVADVVERGLTTGALGLVGEGMNAAADLLRQAQVSTPRLEELMQFATAHGAVGAKPTGAGGGGCVLALFPVDITTDAMRKIKSELRESFPAQCQLYEVYL